MHGAAQLLDALQRLFQALAAERAAQVVEVNAPPRCRFLLPLPFSMASTHLCTSACPRCYNGQLSQGTQELLPERAVQKPPGLACVPVQGVLAGSFHIITSNHHIATCTVVPLVSRRRHRSAPADACAQAGKASLFAQGKRRYDRKQAGFGGQVRPLRRASNCFVAHPLANFVLMNI